MDQVQAPKVPKPKLANIVRRVASLQHAVSTMRLIPKNIRTSEVDPIDNYVMVSEDPAFDPYEGDPDQNNPAWQKLGDPKSPRKSVMSRGEELLTDGGRICLPKELTTRIDKFKWNVAFQELYDQILQNAGSDDMVIVSSLRQMYSVYSDFLRTANMYAKIIVSERFLPNEMKTVKPVDVGGVAGGDKFIAEGIFFKFALDKGLYGGTSNAEKSAGHELKSMNVLLNLQHPALHFPLFVVIDYLGFRVSAMSLLPVSHSVRKPTQRFGSSNGGVQIFNEDTVLQVHLKEVANAVGLKAHFVGEKGALKEIYLPVDCEVHYGTDGRYYVLDTARLMPPEPPTIEGSHLFRLLRPEFVSMYAEKLGKPLCSDSFTQFLQNDPKRKVHAAELREALHYLRTVVVPHFAEELMKSDKEPVEVRDRIALKPAMHTAGLNLRCLGLVYDAVSSPYWRSRLMTQMVLRVAKSTVRILMRTAMEKIKLPTQEPYIRVLVEYFNLLFGSSRASKEYWALELTQSIRLSFFYHYSQMPVSPLVTRTFETQEEVHPSNVIFANLLPALLALIGVTLKPTCAVLKDGYTILDQQQPFSESDFSKISPTQKNMDLVVYSETFMLYEKYFKFGHKLEMVEPMMKKIAASRTPGPFYVPYMCAVACFNVWIQLKNTHSSTTWRNQKQQTVESISADLALRNIPQLTTERILAIVENSVLLQQALAAKPLFFEILDSWAASCFAIGCWDFGCAIYCCQAWIHRKLGNNAKFQEYIRLVRENASKVAPTAKLAGYFQERWKAVTEDAEPES